jgi:hypothetical protein
MKSDLPTSILRSSSVAFFSTSQGSGEEESEPAMSQLPLFGMIGLEMDVPPGEALEVEVTLL